MDQSGRNCLTAEKTRKTGFEQNLFVRNFVRNRDSLIFCCFCRFFLHFPAQAPDLRRFPFRNAKPSAVLAFSPALCLCSVCIIK